jgi:catalase
VLVAPGIDGAMVRALYAALVTDGAVPRLVGQRLGKVEAGAGGSADQVLDVEITLETGPSVLYDALVLPDGAAAIATLAKDGRALEFVREQYRHGKPILALGAGSTLLRAAGVPFELPGGAADPGLIFSDGYDLRAALAAFEAALARHRVYARETDPPRV